MKSSAAREEPFSEAFAVRSGSFKQVVLDQEGVEQITHFHLPDELMGLESISEGSHVSFIIALERATVCEIPFHQLVVLTERLPALRNQLYRSMSQGMGDDRRLIRLTVKAPTSEWQAFC
ncbi:cyclic nucleotide-binding domain-containing protein [Salinicola peritrichatus]|uniref:cyclic nucleotide-binding domain-containing protein n=1 Tax=Salinicola peritrichatus TaxID=1267424 RepID=UPI0013A637CE|nr:cyclic nucleotide-binding domain-containing protein [Salinicola peritrichatus]